MSAMLDLIRRHKSGVPAGIYSVCSAHPLVLEAALRLAHRTEGVAESYSRVAALMQDELQALDDHSLDAVSRKMQDSERRLDLGFERRVRHPAPPGVRA